MIGPKLIKERRYTVPRAIYEMKYGNYTHFSFYFVVLYTLCDFLKGAKSVTRFVTYINIKTLIIVPFLCMQCKRDIHY